MRLRSVSRRGWVLADAIAAAVGAGIAGARRVPAEMRGTGFRIEENVLITDDGYRML